jgi:hypothetical protein
VILSEGQNQVEPKSGERGEWNAVDGISRCEEALHAEDVYERSFAALFVEELLATPSSFGRCQTREGRQEPHPVDQRPRSDGRNYKDGRCRQSRASGVDAARNGLVILHPASTAEARWTVAKPDICNAE